ncbi:MAG: rhomboid family intramembrane serine protease, partial [Actinomycetota bacterium]
RNMTGPSCWRWMTVQAPDRQRFGIQRPPVVTAVVFVVTATTSVLGLQIPGVLEALQRTPQGLHGERWRTFTTLMVQDGGVVGTLSNLAFLLVMGVVAEQVLEAWRWLVCYFGAGLAGELAGYAWQPHGAGNSVAVCGLAGALVVALLAGSPVPRLVPMVLLYWCGALLSVRWGAGPLVVGIVAAAAVQLVPSWTVAAGRLVAGAAIVAALALTAASDIHGAALLAGILLAAATRRPRPAARGR